MQQSMYGVIAAAHSKGSIGASFQQDSGSDTDTEVEGSKRNIKETSQATAQGLSGRPSSDEKRDQSQRPRSDVHRKTKTTDSAVLHTLSKANLSKMSCKFKTLPVSEALSRTGTNLL